MNLFFKLTVDVSETYTRKQFLSQNTILSIYVCKTTIQGIKKKKYSKNPELLPDFFLLKNCRVFWEKLEFFVVPPKFDQNKFFKNSKRTWLSKVWTNKKWLETLISEPLVAVDYRRKNRIFTCPLWSPETTKSGFFFSRALTQPIAQAPPDLKFLELESWSPCARKVPILANFEADLKKYTCFFWAGTN
jgi:hypothetical protein